MILFYLHYRKHFQGKLLGFVPFFNVLYYSRKRLSTKCLNFLIEDVERDSFVSFNLCDLSGSLSVVDLGHEIYCCELRDIP